MDYFYRHLTIDVLKGNSRFV